MSERIESASATSRALMRGTAAGVLATQSVAAPGSVTDRRAARSLRRRAGFTPRQNDITEACACVQAGATQFSCFRFPLRF